MLTNELVLESDQQSLQSHNWDKIKTEDRFFKDFFKGAGFKFESSMAEFIDNSISAGATQIKIKTVPTGDYYSLIIEDNGHGISHQNIKNVFNLGTGTLSDYKSNSISYYGVGMKFAIVNLSNTGITKLISVQNGHKSTIFMDVTDIPCISEPVVEDFDGPNGTKIIIPNVILNSNKINPLLKFLGVSYFPHIDNGNKLTISIEHDKEVRNVVFTDPLYRNLNSGTSLIKGIIGNDDEVYINGLKIKIRARYFDESFNSDDYSFWDRVQGTSTFSGNKSGVYFRLNGRYITLGENKFYIGGATRSGSNRIRIEVDIDRDLIQLIGVNFNKSKIELNDDDSVKSFTIKLNEMVSWGVKMYNTSNNSNPEISPETKEEREDLNRDLNARRKKLNNESDANAPIFEPEDKDTSTSGSKNRPKLGKYKKHEKNALNIIYKEMGKDKAFDYWNKNGMLEVAYNTKHEFYNKYQKMSKESKKLIDTYTIALCDSFNITKYLVPMDTSIYDEMVQELLFAFSRRLSNYNND